MSVAELQGSLVQLVRSTILESLPACLFMDFGKLTNTNSDSSSRTQVETSALCNRVSYSRSSPEQCVGGFESIRYAIEKYDNGWF